MDDSARSKGNATSFIKFDPVYLLRMQNSSSFEAKKCNKSPGQWTSHWKPQTIYEAKILKPSNFKDYL